MKGQARKAKAKEAVAAELQRWIANPNDSICNHGQAKDTPEVCIQFITSFFRTLYDPLVKTMILSGAVKTALNTAYCKYGDAMVNENYRESSKRIFISNGVSSLLEPPNEYHLQLARGCAAALMLIDSYAPSSPVPLGKFDERDAKHYMRDIDILDGCSRSLVKFFVNQIPCNCLDELYAQIKSTIPKISTCTHCSKRKERSSIFICTGCKRAQYCSELCQIANAPIHKRECRIWQSGKYTYDL